MSRQPKGKEKKNVETSLREGVENEQLNSIFGKYSEAEMIARLKGLALDPGRPEYAPDNIRPLWSQIFRLRKVMVLKDSEIPWRKRKLEQFVKDKLRAPPPCFTLSSPQTTTKMSRRQSSHASSISCLLNSVDSTKCQYEKMLSDSRSSSSLLTSEDQLLEKQVSTECSFLVDLARWNFPNKDTSPTIDTDESINGSNPLTPENPPVNDPPSVEINKAVRNWNSPKLNRSNLKSLHSPRRISNFKGYRIQKNVIPVGPRFQVDDPEWTGPVSRSAYNKDSDNSKWLGTRIWPIEIGNMKTTGRTIGKGRPDSCSCTSPGSVDCIRRHVLEKRLLLQCDLGPAFYVWRFDEMGEQISKLWNPKEQQTFESMVMRPSSNGKNFLKHALKCLPQKSRKEIVSYYFDVYIPHRMSLQTRSLSIKEVDTDDEDEDEAGNSNYMGVQKKSGGRNAVASSSKVAKSRYLRGAS